MPRFATVDEYVAALPEDRRGALQQLRETVRAASPEATETIAYDMPALRTDGQFLVSYAAYKRHYSLFPWTDAMVEQLGAELEPYAAGKGTIRFPADAPLPLDLISRIVALRVEENAAARKR